MNCIRCKQISRRSLLNIFILLTLRIKIILYDQISRKNFQNAAQFLSPIYSDLIRITRYVGSTGTMFQDWRRGNRVWRQGKKRMQRCPRVSAGRISVYHIEHMSRRSGVHFSQTKRTRTRRVRDVPCIRSQLRRSSKDRRPTIRVK